MTSQRSWLITVLFTAACGVAASIVNACLFRAMDTCASCRLTLVWRLGAALVGALLLARFLIESPRALRGPTAPSTYATGVIARVGEVRYVVPGVNTFFSTTRVLQLLGIVVCLAMQFVIFDAPSQEPEHGKRPSEHFRRDRFTA